MIFSIQDPKTGFADIADCFPAKTWNRRIKFLPVCTPVPYNYRKLVKLGDDMMSTSIAY